ncbi:phage tail tube protein [Azotobacter salinestris]
MARLGGTISIKVDGEIYNAVGNFTYNLGQPLRAGLVGPDGVHGYSEMPQIPFIEGEIRDRREISLETLQNLTDATVTLELANGKVVVLRNAWYASEGTFNTEEGNGAFRFEGLSGEEIR